MWDALESLSPLERIKEVFRQMESFEAVSPRGYKDLVHNARSRVYDTMRDSLRELWMHADLKTVTKMENVIQELGLTSGKYADELWPNMIAARKDELLKERARHDENLRKWEMSDEARATMRTHQEIATQQQTPADGEPSSADTKNSLPPARKKNLFQRIFGR